MVRVVHNWFASTDDWDDQMEGHTYGWVAFFRILRLYLASFRGQHGVSFQIDGDRTGAEGGRLERAACAVGYC